MSGQARAVEPDVCDSDDEAWLIELIAARGDAPFAGAGAPAWTGDSEVTEWLAELCSGAGYVSSSASLPACASAAPARRPEVKAVAIVATARSNVPKAPPSRGHGRKAPARAEINPIGYLPVSERTHLGMPDPRVSKEPGAGTCPDPSDRRGAAISTQPSGHPCSLAPAAGPAPATAPKKRKFESACFPEAVLRLPATRGILEQLADDPVMELDLPPPRSVAGVVLTLATAVVARRLQPGPAVFKIGITTNPIHRWHNNRYGYRLSHERFESMVVLLATDRGDAAAYLEAALISRFQHIPGCRNVAPGGEGLIPSEGPFLLTW